MTGDFDGTYHQQFRTIFSVSETALDRTDADHIVCSDNWYFRLFAGSHGGQDADG
jgi:hypothetical protein